MLAWRKGFYGYTIAGSAFIVYLLLGGSYYALSVLAPVMAESLGWSATEFGAAFSIFALLGGGSAPLGGILVGRFGPRKVLMAGSLMEVAALALLSVTTETWHLYASAILLGFGMGMAVLLPVQQLVGNWFVARRSLFLGMVLTGAGFGGLAITSLSSNLVRVFGSWRPVWQILAGVMLFPGLLALLLLRDKPEDLGQRADGLSQDVERDSDATSPEKTSRVYKTTIQWDTRAALGTRAFWLAATASGVMFFLLQAITAHQVAYLSGEAGVSFTVAASAMGLIAGCSILGRLFAGWLGDRVEVRFVMAGLLLTMALSLAILLVNKGVVTLYVYVLLFGLGYGGMIVVGPALMLNYFGLKSYAAIMGIAMPAGTILGALSPLLVGGIKDAGGSYVPGFILMTGVAVIGAICAVLARPPLPRPVITT